MPQAGDKWVANITLPTMWYIGTHALCAVMDTDAMPAVPHQPRDHNAADSKTEVATETSIVYRIWIKCG